MEQSNIDKNTPRDFEERVAERLNRAREQNKVSKQDTERIIDEELRRTKRD